MNSAVLQHGDAETEIDEQPAQYTVDPDHHGFGLTLGLPDAAGCLRREGRDAEAPQRSVKDEDQAEQQESGCLVRRICRHELRQECQEKQRHFRIERIRQHALPEYAAELRLTARRRDMRPWLRM